MHESWLDVLRAPGAHAAFDLDAARRAGPEIVEGFLVSRHDRRVWPLLAGVAVLVPDLRAHLREEGAVYWRTPILDPRVARFVLGLAGRGLHVVPFDEVVRRYGDLVPAGAGVASRPAAQEDLALASLLEAHAPTRGRGLDVGAGVGRGVFVLVQRLSAALGLDRSLACTRRARNIAVTREDFFLPQATGVEQPLDLGRLAREGADFVVGDACALPLADGACDVVVLRARDARGAFTDPGAAAAEAARVLAPGGLLLLEAGQAMPPGAWREVGRQDPFVGWKRA